MDFAMLEILLPCFLLFCSWRLLKARSLSTRDEGFPTVVSVIPWVGAALGLAQDSFNFMHKCWGKYGGGYKIPIQSGNIAIFCSEEGMKDVFRDKTRSFNAGAGHRIGIRLIGGVDMDLQGVHLYDKDLGPVISRAFLTTNGLDLIVPTYGMKLFEFLSNLSNDLGDSNRMFNLTTLMGQSLYKNASVAVFGDHFPDNTFDDFMHLDENFSRLMIPIPFYSRSALQARNRLLQSIQSYVRSVWTGSQVEGAPRFASELITALKGTDLSDKDQAGLLLAFMWGMHANTIRVAGFLFIHLLSDHQAFTKVREEIDSILKSSYADDVKTFLETPYSSVPRDEFPLLDSAVKETLRLSVLLSNLREAQREVEVDYGTGKRARVRKGDLVLLNMGSYFRDEAVCSDADNFRFDRFVSGENTPALSAFGGGAHMCKGRLVAVHEIKVLFILFTRFFEMSLVDEKGAPLREKLPPPETRSTAVSRPSDKIHIRLRRKPSKSTRSIVQGP